MSNTFELIYAIARRIPVGRVATYGQIARMAGNPRMSRIVGCAMHAAPEDVPCHRVVNRAGALCDAFEPMGKETHRLLLEMEGVGFLPDGNVDLAKHQWNEEADGLRLNRILEVVRAEFSRILRDKLTGIYIHGSIAFGCFRWEVSDVDFLAVVRMPLTMSEKTEIIRALLDLTPDAPPKGIEMSVVTEDICRNFVHPAPYELHFSNAHAESYRADIEGCCRRLQGTDPDLAAHFAVTRAVGQTLCGEPVGSVFALVPRESVLDSVRADVAEADMDDNPVYFTLNLCRVLAYQEEGLLLSKRGGGEWGLENLPKEHHAVIRAALTAYVEAGTGGVIASGNALKGFCTYAKKRIFG